MLKMISEIGIIVVAVDDLCPNLNPTICYFPPLARRFKIIVKTILIAEQLEGVLVKNFSVWWTN